MSLRASKQLKEGTYSVVECTVVTYGLSYRQHVCPAVEEPYFLPFVHLLVLLGRLVLLGWGFVMETFGDDGDGDNNTQINVPPSA